MGLIGSTCPQSIKIFCSKCIHQQQYDNNSPNISQPPNENIQIQTPSIVELPATQIPFINIGPQIDVQIKLINGQTINVKLLKILKGLDLKKSIQKTLKSSLKVNEMRIYRGNLQIEDDDILSQLMNERQKFKVDQRRLPNKRKVEVELLNRQIQVIQIFDDLTGIKIKEFINLSTSQELLSKDMTLYCGDIKIHNDMALFQLKLNVKSTIKIIQKRLEVADYYEPELQIYPDKEDEETYESGVVKMSCGCFIGQEAMLCYMKSLASQSKNEIRCRKHPNQQWGWNICQKVARLTLTQKKEISQYLNKNYITNEINTMKMDVCANDKCKAFITIVDPTLLHIQCPSCQEEYCFKCKGKWSNTNNKVHCGNNSCLLIKQEINKLLSDCPLKNMTLTQNGKRRVEKVPNLRACVGCKSMLQHVQKCKHMICPQCKTNFCFLCLGKPQKNVWSCGGAYQYCPIHPRQKFD